MYVNQGIRWEGDLATNRNRTSLLAWCQASGQGSEQIKDTAEDPSTAPGGPSAAGCQLTLAGAWGAHPTPMTSPKLSLELR